MHPFNPAGPGIPCIPGSPLKLLPSAPTSPGSPGRPRNPDQKKQGNIKLSTHNVAWAVSVQFENFTYPYPSTRCVNSTLVSNGVVF